MIKVYSLGDVVRCVKNPHCIQELTIGDLYEVKSATVLNGEWVYGLRDCQDNIFYSVDNFVLEEEEIYSVDNFVLAEEEEEVEMPEHDTVNSPSHYTAGGLETIDILKAKLSKDEFKGFLRGNVIKYLTRAGLKSDELEDLKKAQWYLNRLIQDGGLCNFPLKLGDRVKSIKGWDGNQEIVGREGIVIKLHPEIMPTATIEFFDRLVMGHSEEGAGKKDHCWNIPATEEYFKIIDRKY